MKFHNKFLSCAQCVVFPLLLVQMTLVAGSSGDGKFAECMYQEFEQGTSPEDAFEICERYGPYKTVFQIMWKKVRREWL